MIQRNVWRYLSIPLVLVILVLLDSGSNANPGTPARADTPQPAAKPTGAVGTYDATQESRTSRVTLLGITKGVAFLASQDLVDDGGREHGNNTVPWLRINVLVERLADKTVEPISWELETADGQNLVEKTTIQSHGFSISSQASGTAQMDMPCQQLTSTLFPTAPPTVANPNRSSVFALTVSGHFRKTDKAVLILGIGEGIQREEVVFKDVPIP